jgi:formylglycine-generating enzyme required for sulfatase activity
MGNTGAYSGDGAEKPVHQVTISRDFYMSKYEITQAQYIAVMDTNPSSFNGDNLPVERVSWYNAVEFCNKLSVLEGLENCYTINGTDVQCNWNAKGYRLPTEAEWEYACKAGTTTDFYNGSLTNPECTPLDNNLDQIGWYCGNSGYSTHTVGQKAPNSFGLYDMSGNVWEWCWDWYGTYDNTSVTDPNGALSGSARVARGGGWYDLAFDCRSANRGGNDPDNRSFNLGFRVVSPK